MTVDEWACPSPSKWSRHRTPTSVEGWELGPDGRYVRACSATEGAVQHVPGCDGLVVDLDALWAEVDRLVAP
jgi:hypothetical protein